MDIHEYQAKDLLKQFGVSVPRGGIAYSPEQAVYRSHELSGEKCVVKAQIRIPGRAARRAVCGSVARMRKYPRLPHGCWAASW